MVKDIGESGHNFETPNQQIIEQKSGTYQTMSNKKLSISLEANKIVYLLGPTSVGVSGVYLVWASSGQNNDVMTSSLNNLKLFTL